jgi:thiamine monophosphate synthase
LPVLAVGGVTAERIPAVSRAGAMGIAAIGLFADSPEERLSEIVERIRGKR